MQAFVISVENILIDWLMAGWLENLIIYEGKIRIKYSDISFFFWVNIAQKNQCSKWVNVSTVCSEPKIVTTLYLISRL